MVPNVHSTNTFSISKRGQPLYKGQNDWSKHVLYSEVPLNTILVIILNIFMCIDSSTNISNKTPELNDVYQLLEDKSVHWDRIGRKLGVPVGVRAGLQKDQALTNDQRLETVLNLWLERGGDLSTWDQLMKSLEELNYNDVVRKIRTFLEVQPQ